jgi:hypothetical protein
MKRLRHSTPTAAPLKLKNAIYWDALDQKAGALRGLKKKDEANWDFFQVFIHRKPIKNLFILH